MDVGSIFQRVKGLAKSVAKMPKDSDYDYEEYDDEIEEEEDDYYYEDDSDDDYKFNGRESFFTVSFNHPLSPFFIIPQMVIILFYVL